MEAGGQNTAIPFAVTLKRHSFTSCSGLFESAGRFEAEVESYDKQS
jgi:hypothetical protein